MLSLGKILNEKTKLPLVVGFILALAVKLTVLLTLSKSLEQFLELALGAWVLKILVFPAVLIVYQKVNGSSRATKVEVQNNE